MAEARSGNKIVCRAALMLSLGLLGFGFGRAAVGQEKDFDAYSEHVTAYLQRIYDPSKRSLAYREDYPGGFEQWQMDALGLLCRGPKTALAIRCAGR